MIEKGLITLSGLGKRLRPLTLGIPKGMLPIGGKAMFHYVLDEFVEAGIKEIILLHNPYQNIFRTYIRYLQKANGFKNIKIHFALQRNIKGTLDAVYQIKKFLKKGEPFLIAYSDDLLINGKRVIRKMIRKFSQSQKPVVLLEKVPKDRVKLYGVIEYEKKINNWFQIKRIVEKPDPKIAPSNLILIGRFILPYEILKVFEKLESKFQNSEKEIGIDLGFNEWLREDVIFGLLNQTKRFDCGSKDGFIKAQAYFSKNVR